MAEYMMKHLIEQNGWEDLLMCDSAATSYEEIGNTIHYGAKRELDRHSIPAGNHRARHMRPEDYDTFDYIIGMDEENMYNLNRYYHNDPKHRIFLLLGFAGKNRDIANPWYTGNFRETYEDLEEGLEAFTEYLKKNAVLPQ